MHGTAQSLETRNGLGAEEHGSTIGASLRGNCAICHRRHGNTTGGDTPMKFDEPVRDQIVSGRTFKRRGLYEPVPQGERT
jgi:mono/diheme cytochrome c family protein